MSAPIFEIAHGKDFFVMEGNKVEAWLDGRYDAPAYTGTINDAPERVTNTLLEIGVINRRETI